MSYKHLNASDVVFTMEAEEDDCEVRGNAMASGDDTYDSEVENEILARLNVGDIWAWASVLVTATDSKTGLTGHDYLRSCSYKHAADFIQTSGYYEDMKHTALDNLNQERYRMWRALSQ